MNISEITLTIDCRDIAEELLLLELQEAIDDVRGGDIVSIMISAKDIGTVGALTKEWCAKKGHHYVGEEELGITLSQVFVEKNI